MMTVTAGAVSSALSYPRGELAALPAADPAKKTGSGPVPWRRLIPRVAPLMIIYFCQGCAY
jgi:hypothetical protein